MWPDIIYHPAIVNTRLHQYNGKTVTFWFKNHENKQNFVTMRVQEFIKALIQHIPDYNFKMIRYYDTYSRRIKKQYSEYLQRSLKQTTFGDFVMEVNKWAPELRNCGRKIIFVLYEKEPPIENEVFE